MIKNKHSETDLPKWRTHKLAKKLVPLWARPKVIDFNENVDHPQDKRELKSGDGKDELESGEENVEVERDEE